MIKKVCSTTASFKEGEKILQYRYCGGVEVKLLFSKTASIENKEQETVVLEVTKMASCTTTELQKNQTLKVGGYWITFKGSVNKEQEDFVFKFEHLI